MRPIMHWIWVFYFLISTSNVLATPISQDLNDLNTYQLEDASDNTYQLGDASDNVVAAECSTQAENNIDGFDESGDILSEIPEDLIQAPTVFRRNPAVCKPKQPKQKYYIEPYSASKRHPYKVDLPTHPIEKSDRCPEDKYSFYLSCGGYAIDLVPGTPHDLYKMVTNCVEGT